MEKYQLPAILRVNVTFLGMMNFRDPFTQRFILSDQPNDHGLIRSQIKSPGKGNLHYKILNLLSPPPPKKKKKSA